MEEGFTLNCSYNGVILIDYGFFKIGRGPKTVFVYWHIFSFCIFRAFSKVSRLKDLSEIAESGILTHLH